MPGDDVDPWFLQLADGEEPDWAALESRFAGDPQRLARLRRAARLVGALTSSHRGERETDAGAGRRSWGHLRLVERLGSGSYGEVFRAFDPVLEREVAVKLRHEDAGGVAAGAFIAEARRLARIRHPHVLAVHGAGVHDSRAGLWCDLVEGRTLSAAVEADGALPWRELLRQARDLASALAAVHAAGLVHGDVKPANVMIECDSGRIVLMDFGSASERELAARTGLAGSPITMAAEQREGRPVGPPSDVYSLGVVIHYMACGRYPATAQGVPARPLPGPLRALLGRCLSDDPAARPDAPAVVAALDRLVDAPRRRRRQLAVGTVLASLALALAASLYALVRVGSERDRALEARARESEVRRFLVDMLAAPAPSSQGAGVLVRDVLDDARSALDTADDTPPQVRAALLGTLGNSYLALGLYEPAVESLRQAHRLVAANAGPDAAEAIEAEVALAEAELLLGPGEAAVARLEHAVARAGAVLGQSGRVVVSGTLRLGEAALSANDTDAALRHVEGLLAIADSAPGAVEASQHSMALSQRARLHQLRGETQAATQRLAEALALLGPDSTHPNAMVARGELARMAAERGDLQEAEALYREMLALAQARYGEDHPNLPVTLNNLGTALIDQRRFAEAVPLIERALAVASRRPEPSPVQLFGFRTNLANALAETGRLAEAGAEREALLEFAVSRFGRAHPQALIARVNLAEQRVLECRWDEAAGLAASALELARSSFPASHLFVLEPEEIAARAALGSGAADGVEGLDRVCKAKRNSLGDAHPHALKCDVHLAQALARRGDQAGAEAMLARAVAASTAAHGAGHPLTTHLVGTLAADGSGNARRCGAVAG